MAMEHTSILQENQQTTQEMKDRKIIFLISLPRSGSTLLQKMLAVSPEIYSVAEPWLMLPLASMLKEEGTLTQYSHEIAFHAFEDLIKELPHGKTDFYHEIEKFSLSLYGKMAAGRSCKYFLDKTPRYYLIIPLLAEIFTDAKFIFLFRNPLDVLSSILTSWKKDRFILYKHYADVYYGPRAMSEGYALLKDRAVSVNYHDLVKSPAFQMQKVCSYLDIPYDHSMIENYKNVQFSGRWGDTTGIRQFDSVSTDSLEKWKKVLNTHYRKWFSKRYINHLGPEILTSFGLSVTELMNEIDSITSLRAGSLRDIFYHFSSTLMRLGNIEVYKRLIAAYKKKERYFPYT